MSEYFKKVPIRGRGSLENLPNRFEKRRYEHEDGDFVDRDGGFAPAANPANLQDEGFASAANPANLQDEGFASASPKTQIFADHSKTIINFNDSPDIGFDASINPYRGCEHGCIYCYARPTHEWLGMSPGLDFETKIFVKYEAPKLLREELAKDKWEPQPLAISGVTDCYQPIERELKITRQCLEVLADFRNPYGIVTKNHLVTRDIDIHKQMADLDGCMIYITITSLDPELTAILEPRTSRPARRLEAVRMLTEAGVPVGILIAPTIPGLNDHEVPAILEAASKAGAEWAGYVPLRLPLAVGPLFTQWLETHRPDSKEKILERIRDLRGGKLNDSNFGSRMRGQGAYAEQIKNVFRVYAKRYGFNQRERETTTKYFRRLKPQMSFFE
ncbi:MAG TPA: PA0069 family radical SAM protein [Bdellovibrionales bacterium]|nr:PA0069 family radical SAM protein [Bdellovibrionales bacterium]